MEGRGDKAVGGRHAAAHTHCLASTWGSGQACTSSNPPQLPDHLCFMMKGAHFSRWDRPPAPPRPGERAQDWRQQTSHGPSSSRCLPHGWDPISLLPPTRPPRPTSGPFSLPRHLQRRQKLQHRKGNQQTHTDCLPSLHTPVSSSPCSRCLHSFTHTPSSGSAHPQLVQRRAPNRLNN